MSEKAGRFHLLGTWEKLDKELSDVFFACYVDNRGNVSDDVTTTFTWRDSHTGATKSFDKETTIIELKEWCKTAPDCVLSYTMCAVHKTVLRDGTPWSMRKQFNNRMITSRNFARIENGELSIYEWDDVDEDL